MYNKFSYKIIMEALSTVQAVLIISM